VAGSVRDHVCTGFQAMFWADCWYRRGDMADSSTADLGKGKRITGGDRSSLADELRKRYDGGESIRSLATSTNRSYGFVHRLLSESGASLRSRGGANRNSKKA
jgi:hypothetical protein